MKNRYLIIALILVVLVATANLVMIGTTHLRIAKLLESVEYQSKDELVPSQTI